MIKWQGGGEYESPADFIKALLVGLLLAMALWSYMAVVA